MHSNKMKKDVDSIWAVDEGVVVNWGPAGDEGHSRHLTKIVKRNEGWVPHTFSNAGKVRKVLTLCLMGN